MIIFVVEKSYILNDDIEKCYGIWRYGLEKRTKLYAVFPILNYIELYLGNKLYKNVYAEQLQKFNSIKLIKQLIYSKLT